MILIKSNFDMVKYNLTFFCIFLSLQIIFWYNCQHIRPKLDILPKLQSEKAIEALSFGDKEFYFRNLSIRLQNSGDRFGHFTSFKKYDYEILYKWLTILSNLNYNSKFTPAIATYYYSAVPDSNRVRWIVKFLEEYAEKDINENWWWMFQAITLSNRIIKDNDLALKIAYKLSKANDPNIPYFTKQMPAIIHAKMGHNCQSYLIMSQLKDQYHKKIADNMIDEVQFMNIFIEENLKKLKEKNFNPAECKIKN